MDMQELVRIITQEVVKRLHTAEPEKNCVRVLAQRETQLEAKLVELLGIETDLVFHNEVSHGEDSSLKKSSRYILPFLSCSAMADLAAGQASNAHTDARTAEVLHLLLAGVGVEVLAFEYKKYSETAPEALYKLYESYETKLVSYGLQQFKQAQPTLRFRDRLVTEKTVIQAQKSGATTLLVPLATIVTPLAAETARNLNISILKSL